MDSLQLRHFAFERDECLVDGWRLVGTQLLETRHDLGDPDVPKRLDCRGQRVHRETCRILEQLDDLRLQLHEISERIYRGDRLTHRQQEIGDPIEPDLLRGFVHLVV